MLDIKNLNAYYGQAQALFDVSLVVNAGEVVLLRGLNGAGKSTLFKSIMGLVDAPQATIDKASRALCFAGQSLCGLQPYARAKLGLGYVAEERRLFTDLTVQENLAVALPASLTQFARDQLQVSTLALFPILKTMLHRSAAHMSGGEQQMLAIARALMTQPKMLLLDEPMEGLAPVLVEVIVQALQALKSSGMTMLIAEQNRAIDALADRHLTVVSGRLLQ